MRAIPVVGAFNCLGIASRRASHRRRRIMFTYGDVKYSELKGDDADWNAVRLFAKKMMLQQLLEGVKQ